jgi:glycosyltransferase involved in cell wall biosynthesis
LRILLVSHCLPPDNLGGVEIYTEHVARTLARAGHAVTLLTRRLADGEASIERESLPGGVPVRRIRAPLFPRHGSGLLDADVRALTRAVVGEAAPEVVHCTHLMHHSPHAVAEFRRAGAAVVLSLLDAFPLCPRANLIDVEGRACPGARAGRECVVRCFAGESARRRRLWRVRARHFERLLARADRLLCPSRFVHARYLPFAPDPTRLEILPLPLGDVPDDPAPPRSPLAPTAALELAFVGALVPEKGCDLILEALALEAPARTRLRVLGHSPDPAYRERLVRRAAGIAGLELDLLPPFARGGLAARLDGVAAVIVPSRVEETFSLVTREALACGIPVLAARRGALPEVVRDGVNGRLFEPERPRELADAILSLARDPAYRETLAQGARATPFTRLDDHVAALEDVFRRSIAARRPPPFSERILDRLRLPRPRA